MDFFTRTELLLGKENMSKLKMANIICFGLGGVGGHTVEALARTGIGSITIVDFDVINPSNINRQIFALNSTINKKKIDIAKNRILDINPQCNVDAIDLFINQENIPELFNKKFDIVLDAIDSLSSKVALLEFCVKNNIYVISSMGASTRTDPSAIRVADLFKTQKCPLARFVRKRLRKRNVTGGIKCVYSIEQKEKSHIIKNKDDLGRTKNILGSVSYITGIFGLVMAKEAISHLIS